MIAQFDFNQITVSEWESQPERRNEFMQMIKKSSFYAKLKDEIRFLIDHDIHDCFDKMSLFYKQKFISILIEAESIKNKFNFISRFTDEDQIQASLIFIDFLSNPNENSAENFTLILMETAFEYYKKDIESIFDEVKNENSRKITEFKS